jgi:hypothetical protein
MLLLAGLAKMIYLLILREIFQFGLIARVTQFNHVCKLLQVNLALFGLPNAQRTVEAHPVGCNVCTVDSAKDKKCWKPKPVPLSFQIVPNPNKLSLILNLFLS